MRHSVDLPEPDGPMTTTTSPRVDRQVDVLQHVQLAEPLVDAGQADEWLSVRPLVTSPTLGGLGDRSHPRPSRRRNERALTRCSLDGMPVLRGGSPNVSEQPSCDNGGDAQMTTKVERSIQVDVPVTRPTTSGPSSRTSRTSWAGSRRSASSTTGGCTGWPRSPGSAASGRHDPRAGPRPEDRLGGDGRGDERRRGAGSSRPARLTIGAPVAGIRARGPRGAGRRQARHRRAAGRRDLERFKALVEDQGYASGAWRGGINEGVASARPVWRRRRLPGRQRQGRGLGKTLAAGVAAVAAGVAAGSPPRSLRVAPRRR